MEIYSTEEQQEEAIKRFFRENGVALGLGIVLGLGGLYGWKAYNQHQVDSASQASDAFNTLVENEDGAKVLQDSEQFISEYANSNYAQLAAFVAAKEAVAADKLDVAAQKLAWVKDSDTASELKAIATTRLARVQLAQKQYDEALNTLNSQLPAAYAATVAELKGDVQLAKGDKDAARNAYQLAVDEGGAKDNPQLQVKLDNLAQAKPAA